MSVKHACLLVAALWVLLALSVSGVRPISDSTEVHPNHPPATSNTEETDDDYLYSLAVPDGTCEHDPATVYPEACTVDEFSAYAFVAGREVECQIAKAETVLSMIGANLEALDREAREATHTLDVEATYNSTHACPESCVRCMGQRYYTMHDGRPLLLLPQPSKTGRSYAYEGDKARPLDKVSDIIYVNESQINKGLAYATSLTDALVRNAQTYLFSNGLQFRLRYLGDDPALIFDLTNWERHSRNHAENMCIGGPNKNVMDSQNFQQYFHQPEVESLVVADEDTTPMRWEESHRARRYNILKSTVTKTVRDADGHPMGTVLVDLNMTGVAEALLEQSDLTGQSYALIFNSYGHIMAATSRARANIFFDGMTAEQFDNPKDLIRCRAGMTSAELQTCIWRSPKPLDFNDALDAEKYSGANFSGMLARLFDNDAINHTCTTDMLDTIIPFPKRNMTHIVSACRFRSLPDWGLMFATPFEEMLQATFATLSMRKLAITRKFRKDDKAPFQEHRSMVLKNTGQTVFPFVVTTDASWLKSVPEKGFLKGGEEVVLQVLIDVEEKPHFGVMHGHLVVRGDMERPRGACWRKHFKLSVTLNVKREYGFAEAIVKEHGVKILIGFLSLILLLMLRAAKYATDEFYNGLAQEAATMKAALNSTSLVAHPMVIMAASAFKRLGKLVSHEDGEKAHELIWLYSIEEVVAFSEKHNIIFVSHQWTAFGEPDPDNIQYDAMVMSIDALRALKEWDEKDMYVWADYTCIPQKHRGLQTLAINSLTSYAANVAAFVVVAPNVMHKDLQEQCDADTYQRRAWCRAEQLSHYLAQGRDDMYLASGDGTILTLLTPQWLEQAVQVFHGDLTCCRRKHEGMAQCDKQLLVVPMLGLWAHLCMRCQDANADAEFHQVHKTLRGKLPQIFPATFQYEKTDGFETRELFGKLVEKLPEALKQYQLEGKDGKSKV